MVDPLTTRFLHYKSKTSAKLVSAQLRTKYKNLLLKSLSKHEEEEEEEEETDQSSSSSDVHINFKDDPFPEF